ncbi:FimV/HubP family polar landmark protein [Comamonas flocculans]|uniref:FimV N-terminal domain-containing protein n=1 Tax=Comamonas flocculans TaxID=2597701 RepID=A0A5B8RWH3_9BURK|nr:FimV/HubP family polar landmark protein [Comamonas flocculans]QEA12157.1 hypothetical protein FOZ74_03400 [Comamonas flocculans]
MHRWNLSLLATAAALSTGLYVSTASALTLGKVTVQSALGEPLRAEVALPRITPAEAESLRVRMASPEVFRAQGLEFSPAVNGIRLELKQQARGGMVLQMSSDRAVSDPFIDLVIDAAWNAGHIVRSYTLLFDPPALRRPSAPAPLAAQTGEAGASGAQATAVPSPSAPPAPRAQTAAPAPAPARAPAPPSENAAREVTVHAGDTAGAIASAHRPGGVSLDQMLLAMLRANPEAFIDGNVNRLRAGAVLQLPGKEAAQATSAAQARKIIAAQIHDFNAFRQRLAGAAPSAGVQSATRADRGKVQTEVAESKPEAAQTDKLTLSKGEAAAKAADDAKTAESRQAQETSARLAELSRNVAELQKIGDGADAAPADSAAPAEPAAAAPAADSTSSASAPPADAPATPAADSNAAAPTADSAAELTAPPALAAAATEPVAAPEPAPAPEAAQPAAAPAPPPAPPAAEPSLLDELTQDPLKAGGALALLVLLLGWAGYRWQQSRRNQHGPETTFADDADHPDSFFAESGGQEVDTTSSDLNTGSTSTLYSPSQLDQIGDVDPVAEADVYLAYGKDPEAEAILKEAALLHPQQVAIPAKLAEIYAKRQDRVGLEAAARQVRELSQGQGPEWERVQRLGAELDGDNPLYRALPAAAGAAAAGIAAAQAPVASPPQTREPTPGGIDAPELSPPPAAPVAPAPDSVLPEIGLDLDLDSGASTPAPLQATTTAAAAAGTASSFAAAAEAARARDEERAADTAPQALPTVPAALAPAPAPAADDLAHTLDFPADDLVLADSGPMPLSKREDAGTEPAALEFDLGDLSLDLSQPASPAIDVSAAAPAAPAQPLPSDPLATKLALAEEFKAIGDSEGARALVEEVLAQADGELKARAERMLGALD